MDKQTDYSGRRWQKIGLAVLCSVLAVVLVLLTFATVYVHYLLGMVNRSDEYYDETLAPEDMAAATESLDPEYTGEVLQPDDIELNPLPSVSLEDQDNDGIINILLVGQDRRQGEPRQRSDSMILCTFNTNSGAVTITSFLRDTYVTIPGYKNNKLNAAYQFGGFSLLNETLAVNYGVHVDANVEVDFSGFMKIIDLLGGVDIELTKAEAKLLNKGGNFKFNSSAEWYLTEGVNHLTGEQALAYARIRDIGYDFARTQRQRTVLEALVAAYKDQELGDMLNLVDDVLPMVTTNMTSNEILSYVVNLFPLLAQTDIVSQAIPAEGTYDEKYISGIGECLIPDLEENREILESTLLN